MRTIKDNIFLIFLGSESTRSIYLYTKGSRRLNKKVEVNSGGKLMEWRSGTDMRSGGMEVERSCDHGHKYDSRQYPPFKHKALEVCCGSHGVEVWCLLVVAMTGSIKGEVVADSSDSVPCPLIWQTKLFSPFLKLLHMGLSRQQLRGS
jgi:hypothetical protein